MGWATLDTAPRDKPIWLYVPAISWTHGEDGRPSHVVNAVVVAQWDKAQGAWIRTDNADHVYPSLWNDANPAGHKPDDPELR